MALEKFHEKDIVCFGLLESTPGTYQSSIAATNAIALTDASGKPTYETGELVFKGAKNDRSISVYQKDSYGEVTIDTPLQVVGTKTFPLTEATFPLITYLVACGGYMLQDTSNKWISFDSSLLTDNYSASVIFQKSTSGANKGISKDTFFYGLVGTVDFNLSVAAEPPTFKFNMKGNTSYDFRKARLQPDTSLQQSLLAPTVRFANIITSQAAQLDGAFKSFATAPTLSYVANTNIVTATATGLGTALGSVGDIRAINLTLGSTTAESQYYSGTFLATVTGANTCEFRIKAIPTIAVPTVSAITYGPQAQTFCLTSLAASNMFGLEVKRVINSCEEGFEVAAMGTDVTIGMLEKHSNRGNPTSITSSATTATLTFDNTILNITPVVGQFITVTGCSNPIYNVENAVISAVNTTTQGAYTIAYPIPVATGTTTVAVASFEVTSQTTVFEPEANMLKYFGFKFKYGLGAGKTITVIFDKLQLTGATDGKSDVYFTKELTLKNSGSALLRAE